MTRSIQQIMYPSLSKLKTIDFFSILRSLCLCIGLFTGSLVQASDHLDVFKSAHDLTDLYVFKSPENNKNVVFVVNYGRSADQSWFFSDDLKFSFVLKKASIASTSTQTGFTLDKEEFRLVCRFSKPTEGQNKAQSGECSLPSGDSLPIEVNSLNANTRTDFKVYAGLRSDPFYLTAIEILKDFVEGNTNFKDPGVNDMQNQNILSIVIEADIELIFGTTDVSLVAVRVEETKTDIFGKLRRIDSVGRPEITNMVIAVPFFDPGQRLKLLRGDFNKQDTFSLQREDKEIFYSRFNSNLVRWDTLDKKVDWPLVNKNHPLTALLYEDYQVLDLSKPFTEKGFLEIEKSMFRDQPHQTSGGRWLDEDIIDDLMTYYIARDEKKYSDFVNQPTKWAVKTFPYLSEPTL